MSELATEKGQLCQSHSHVSYCPNVFSRDDNNVLEHCIEEKFILLVKMQIEETHGELAYFGSFLRLPFRFQKIGANKLVL